MWAGVFIWLHNSNYKRVRDYLVRLVKNALATHFTHVDEVAVIAEPVKFEAEQPTTSID
jgi:hypothetical protein